MTQSSFQFVSDRSDLCACGSEAEIGTHGIKDGQVYSDSWCKLCYDRVFHRSKEGTYAPRKENQENMPKMLGFPH